MKAPTNGHLANAGQGERKTINSELWHACAGPLVSLPPVGSFVVYFPQGHSEQVAASMRKKTDCIPSYPNLPSKMICMLHNVTLLADPETDEVYAQMTLVPVSKYDKEAVLASDIGLKQNRQPAEFFYKTLTASDTSTHGGFSVPRRAAEKMFPPLDFAKQPPAQELVARDLHDSAWTFRHIYRGQPKRHLLTTGWSVFVSTKRLVAGDSILFIRDERSQLLLGLRRANRQLPALSSSVISSDSMHIGILAAAAHASANNSQFTIFYNPRASPCEFVIPLAKYNKAMYAQVSLGMRFRMMFETEESGVRRYMGTVTGVSDLDPVRWKGSRWRNLQVGWDESTAGERPTRVSSWEIEPVVTPFYICPPPFVRPKFSTRAGLPGDEFDIENALKRGMPWIGDDKDAANSVLPGFSLVQWMNMQQNKNIQVTRPGFFPSTITSNDQSKLLSFQTSIASAPISQFNNANQPNQVGQFQQATLDWSQQPPQQQSPQQDPQPRLVQPALVNNGLNHTPNLTTQQPVAYSQLQQQPVVADNTQSQQSIQTAQRNSFHFSSLSQESHIQQQMEHQPSFLQRHQQLQMPLDQSPLQFLQQNMSSHRPEQQPSQQSLAEQQIQVLLLQKLQQQRQQQEQPQPPHQHSQQHQAQQQMLLKQQVHQHQHQKLNENNSSTSFMKSQQFPTNQHQSPYRPVAANRAQSGLTDGDAPSCSTSPSTNNCHSSTSNFLYRNPKAPTMLSRDASVEFASNLVREIKNTPDTRVPNQLKCKGAVTDQLEGSSSATSYCFDAGSLQQSLSVPTLMDGDIQSNQQMNFPYEVNPNGLTPDTMLSRGYNSTKDLQNILSNYGNNPQDFETELTSAAINSHSFGVPDLTFKTGHPSDVSMNDTGVLSGAIWANQTQRLRTYTKVQKRGSVGRSIDVTRYRGYDELRQDLAHMFGIEGQLDDPQRTDWKLVYVDHENDVLLVGDDPWDEFVSCVQSIKILSSVEVQQMSLDGDLGHATIPTNQACSATDSGNIWKGNYDDHSAT